MRVFHPWLVAASIGLLAACGGTEQLSDNGGAPAPVAGEFKLVEATVSDVHAAMAAGSSAR